MARLAGIRAARSTAAASSNPHLAPTHTLTTQCYYSPNATLVLPKKNVFLSLGEAEDVPTAVPRAVLGSCPHVHGATGGDAWGGSSPGKDVSVSSSSSCPDERPGCLDLAFLFPP